MNWISFNLYIACLLIEEYFNKNTFKPDSNLSLNNYIFNYILPGPFKISSVVLSLRFTFELNEDQIVVTSAPVLPLNEIVLLQQTTQLYKSPGLLVPKLLCHPKLGFCIS